jgi:hypothetical protein
VVVVVVVVVTMPPQHLIKVNTDVLIYVGFVDLPAIQYHIFEDVCLCTILKQSLRRQKCCQSTYTSVTEYRQDPLSTL